MDFDSIMKWLGLVALLLSIVNIAWTLHGKAGKALADKLVAIEVQQAKDHADLTAKQAKDHASIIDHDRRIQAVEGELRHLPTATAFHSLQISVTKLEGHLSRLDAAVDAVSTTVRSIDNFLRDETKDGK